MNHTLAWGWFGVIAFFANFYAIGKNLLERRKLTALGEPPGPSPDRTGRPLFARFGVYVGSVVVVGVGYFVTVGALTSDAERLDGACVQLTATEVREVRCSGDHDGKVVAVLDIESDGACPLSADDAIVLEGDESRVVCIDLDQ